MSQANRLGRVGRETRRHSGVKRIDELRTSRRRIVLVGDMDNATVAGVLSQASEVIRCVSVDDAIHACRETGVALIGVGRDVDARSLCRRIRALGSFAPIFCVTADARGTDARDLFSAGADEVITPAERHELPRRAWALLRESERIREILIAPSMSIDPIRRRLVFGGDEALLPSASVRLLQLATHHWGEWISGEDALRELGVALRGDAGAAHLRERVHMLRKAVRTSALRVDYSASSGIRLRHQDANPADVQTGSEESISAPSVASCSVSQTPNECMLVATCDPALRLTIDAVPTLTVPLVTDVLHLGLAPHVRCIVIDDGSLGGGAACISSRLRLSGARAPILVLCPDIDRGRRERLWSVGVDRVADRTGSMTAELCAMAMVRRARGDLAAQLRCGPFLIDRPRHRVTAWGTVLALSRGEVEILFHLCRHGDAVVTIAELCCELLGHLPTRADRAALMQRVLRLRGKLGALGERIETVHGGYSFRAT